MFKEFQNLGLTGRISQFTRQGNPTISRSGPLALAKGDPMSNAHKGKRLEARTRRTNKGAFSAFAISPEAFKGCSSPSELRWDGLISREKMGSEAAVLLLLLLLDRLLGPLHPDSFHS